MSVAVTPGVKETIKAAVGGVHESKKQTEWELVSSTRIKQLRHKTINDC